MGPTLNTPTDTSNLSAAPGGYARLAQRIWGWTTNLLATAVVVVAGLGLGRQVVAWWHADTIPALPDRSMAAVAAAGDPTELQFGDAPLKMTTQQVQGSLAEVLAQLRLAIRAQGEQAVVPPAEPGPAEQRLLASVAEVQPVEVLGSRRIYQQTIGWPMVIAIDQPNGQPARMTAWGLAMPRGEGQWTLHTFRASPAGSQVSSDTSEIPLPPGSQRTISMRTEGGGRLVAFQGVGSVTEWADFYRRWSTEQQVWVATSEASHRGRSWQARYAPRGRAGRTVDVHFSVNDDGKLAGIMSVSGGSP